MAVEALSGTNTLAYFPEYEKKLILLDQDGKIDIGPKTKKSIIGLGKVLHAAETFNSGVSLIKLFLSVIYKILC
jgi:hypothetical protein